jgi:hypothetical protein
MIDVFETHSEHQDIDKCIVFLDDGKRGGLVLNGYKNDTEAMVDLLMHLRAIFRANGKDLEIIGIPNDTSSIEER